MHEQRVDMKMHVKKTEIYKSTVYFSSKKHLQTSRTMIRLNSKLKRKTTPYESVLASKIIRVTIKKKFSAVS